MLTPEQQKLKGLRIITNLHCNYSCPCCFQKNKSPFILATTFLAEQIKLFPEKHFEYATIMGGESTLVEYLYEYIILADYAATNVRLTTNGALLTPELLKSYKKYGLTGITISVPSLSRYNQATGSGKDENFILEKIALARKYIPDTRINIPLCKDNCEAFEYEGPELPSLIAYFVGHLGLNITICEDINGKYKLLRQGRNGAWSVDKNVMGDVRVVENTGTGLFILEYKNKRFGYYAHSKDYNDTDLIISPVGAFISWQDYLEKVK